MLTRRERTPLRKLMLLGAMAGAGALVEDTATGNPLAFITDKAKPLKSLLIPFTPQQSGTGDPSPENIRPILGWNGLSVFGGGKNLLNIDDSLKLAFNSAYSNWSGENGTVTITGNSTGGYITPCKPNTKYSYSFNPTYRGDLLSIRVYEFSDYPQRLTDGTLIYNGSSNANRPPITCTTSDNAKWLVVGFYAHDISENIILRDMQFEVGQTATAYEPYRPITETDIVFPALGKNLFNKNDPKVKPGVWWKGNVLTSGDYGNNCTASEKIPVIPGEAYTLTRESLQQGAVCYFDAEGNYVSQETWDRYTPTRTIPSGVYFVAFTVDNNSVDSAMFNKGSTAQPYEPFTNSVYGCTLDVVSGVLTVEYVGKSTTWGETSKSAPSQETGYVRGVIPFDDMIVIAGQGANAKNSFCNIGKYSWDTTALGVPHFYPGTTSGIRGAFVYLHESTPDETAIQAVCKLVTPQEIQLTPTQLTALIGQNTIWSDADGQMTAVYLKKG